MYSNSPITHLCFLAAFVKKKQWYLILPIMKHVKITIKKIKYELFIFLSRKTTISKHFTLYTAMHAAPLCHPGLMLIVIQQVNDKVYNYVGLLNMCSPVVLIAHMQVSILFGFITGPVKRVYQRYKDDPSIPVPKRTALRHAAASNLSLGSYQTPASVETGAGEQGSDYSATSGDDAILLSDTDSQSANASDNDATLLSDIGSDDSISSDNGVTLLSDTDSHSNDSVTSDNGTTQLSDTDSHSDDDSVTSDNDATWLSDIEDEITYSENEIQALCIVSYIIRHNVSSTATKDLLQLLPILCPDSENIQSMTYEKVMSLAGNVTCKTVHYCSICNTKFPDNPDVYLCSQHGCVGYRYKGPFSAQLKQGRQPRNSFVLADIEKQLKYMLQRVGIWDIVKDTKKKVLQNDLPANIVDITDGEYYRKLCQPGQFLHSSSHISVIMNTDGIPLYSSSNVKLWPVFLAINELPPSQRFARENMILAAIWQGKNKPPFLEYMQAFGGEMCRLHDQGFTITPAGSEIPVVVRIALLLATMDLQAKGYVLNMTMHNGEFGCSSCEESGRSVAQGKGYARYYPYKPLHQREALRDSDDIKYVLGPRATKAHRVKGICGTTGLAVMNWFDIVLGIVPDYMHGVLLGVTKTLLYKFFSPTNSGKPYFIGKNLKHISKRLEGIFPPDYIERMPRDLEKNYTHFKATELQTWLLFYAIPCLNGYLDNVYLHHLSLLSEGIHLLLSDAITEEDLVRAETLLDTFYKDFANLYGEGTCGLNVHNIGAHLAFFVRMWGPIWGWSCFAFEDLNAAVLQSVHGTGDVTKQCLRMKEIQMKLSSVSIKNIPKGYTQSYIKRMKKHGKSWSCRQSVGNAAVYVGALKSLTDQANEIVLMMPDQNIHSLKKALRVMVNDQKLYSEQYSRMKKRVCFVVRCKNGDIRKITFFIVNTETSSIFAFAKKFEIHQQSFICNGGPRHIIRVVNTDEPAIFPVEDIAEKVFFMVVGNVSYIACMPNMVGHGIFK